MDKARAESAGTEVKATEGEPAKKKSTVGPDGLTDAQRARREKRASEASANKPATKPQKPESEMTDEEKAHAKERKRLDDMARTFNVTIWYDPSTVKKNPNE